jgi:hypothetical protein
VQTASLGRFPRPAPGDPLIEAAREQPLGRRFLGWARFPTVQTDTSATGQVLVHLIDLRYADRAGAGFGSVTVPLPVDRISSTSSYTGSAPLHELGGEPALAPAPAARPPGDRTP